MMEFQQSDIIFAIIFVPAYILFLINLPKISDKIKKTKWWIKYIEKIPNDVVFFYPYEVLNFLTSLIMMGIIIFYLKILFFAEKIGIQKLVETLSLEQGLIFIGFLMLVVIFLILVSIVSFIITILKNQNQLVEEINKIRGKLE